MTIDELIAELQRRRELHGGDILVEAIWESHTMPITSEEIYLGKDGNLYIDADGGWDKSFYQHPDDMKNDLPR